MTWWQIALCVLGCLVVLYFIVFCIILGFIVKTAKTMDEEHDRIRNSFNNNRR